MPQSLLFKWRQELGLAPHSTARLGAPASLPARTFKTETERARHTEFRRRVEEYLDAGHGQCWLSRPEIAGLVEDALLHFDAHRYLLLAWCVMPNHVHVLIETKQGFPLDDVLHSWKSFTGSKANDLLGRRGGFWQREYLDRYVRNAEHWKKVIDYIEANPVKAGLARRNTEWLWSSAKIRLGAPASLPASL